MVGPNLETCPKFHWLELCEGLEPKNLQAMESDTAVKEEEEELTYR